MVDMYRKVGFGNKNGEYISCDLNIQMDLTLGVYASSKNIIKRIRRIGNVV